MDNKVAKTLKIIGFGIMVLGFFGGILWANIFPTMGGIDPDTIGWTVAFTCWIYSFIFGMLFIGFAEVINLLDAHNESYLKDSYINMKILDELKKLNSQMVKDENPTKNPSDEVSSIDKQSIKKENKTTNEDSSIITKKPDDGLVDIDKKEFDKISNYLSTYTGIKRITKTPFEHIYLIIFRSKFELIRYRGYMPLILGESNINEINGLKEWYETLNGKLNFK